MSTMCWALDPPETGCDVAGSAEHVEMPPPRWCGPSVIDMACPIVAVRTSEVAASEAYLDFDTVTGGGDRGDVTGV